MDYENITFLFLMHTKMGKLHATFLKLTARQSSNKLETQKSLRNFIAHPKSHVIAFRPPISEENLIVARKGQ